MNLFQLGKFTSHAGKSLEWKIECDALTDEDWECLAKMISDRIMFHEVVGIPRGGNKLASIKSKWDFKDGIIPTILNGSGFNWLGFMNNDHQPQPIDKFGPGGWAQMEADFLGVLRYKRKYRTLVPIQTGLDVTCGDRIKVRVPLANVDNPVWEEKILFVPRLTHQLKFTQGPERNPVTPIGTTDIYGVDWIG